MDEGIAEPRFVPVDGPVALEHKRAVDLGQDECKVSVDAVVNGYSGCQLLGDGLDVATEGTFPVGGDSPGVLGDVGVGPGRLLVDGDHVIHELELARLDVRRQPESLSGIGLRDRLLMAAVDIERRYGTPGDGLEDFALAAEGGVDGLRRNV